MTFSIDQVMRRQWVPVITSTPNADGCYELRVPPLQDFIMFAETTDELEAEWSIALRSHLTGYLAIGKSIPWPVTMQAGVHATDGVTTHGGDFWGRARLVDGVLVEVADTTDMAPVA